MISLQQLITVSKNLLRLYDQNLIPRIVTIYRLHGCTCMYISLLFNDFITKWSFFCFSSLISCQRNWTKPIICLSNHGKKKAYPLDAIISRIRSQVGISIVQYRMIKPIRRNLFLWKNWSKEYKMGMKSRRIFFF